MDAAIRWEASPRIAAYRSQLLGAGFQEAALWHSSPKLGLFYRPCTEQTAFVVDLLGTAHWVEVAYGFASTAFTRIKGNEDSLSKAGVSATEIHLREKLLLTSWEGEPSAREAVAALYRAYPFLEKEELFALVQEKRKAFLRQISRRSDRWGSGNRATPGRRTWRRELFCSGTPRSQVSRTNTILTCSSGNKALSIKAAASTTGSIPPASVPWTGRPCRQRCSSTFWTAPWCPFWKKFSTRRWGSWGKIPLCGEAAPVSGTSAPPAGWKRTFGRPWRRRGHKKTAPLSPGKAAATGYSVPWGLK